MLETVKKTINEFDLVRPGDKILVALSGGPDSVALLYVLCRLRSRLKLNLAAIYINHRIRPSAARREERFCTQLCKKLKVVLEIISEDIPALAVREKKGIEEAARDFRYHTFQFIADRDSFDKIALGHHVDDRAETILFRILRGTGRTGLAGIPVKRKKIIRPLFDITKVEILAYLKKNKLKYCLDQSNLKSDFKRNYIRNKLLVAIRKNLNPSVEKALINLSETATEEEKFLEEIVKKGLKKVVRMTIGGKIELDLKLFCTYDKWIRWRMIRHCLSVLSPNNLTPDKIVVERLEHLATAGGKAVSLPDAVQAVRLENRLVIYRKKTLTFSGDLIEGKVFCLDSLGISFSLIELKYDGRLLRREKQTKTVLIDRDKVVLPLKIRNIRVGDRFKPLGMRGTKKVGDYLTDRKVKRVYRDEIPVVCDRDGIIWLVGFEIADRVKIDKITEKVLKIELQQRRKARIETFRAPFGPG